MNKNLLEEIDFLKSKIIEFPVYVKGTWNRCGGASFEKLIDSPEFLDKIIDKFKNDTSSKWNFIFNPKIYTGTAKELLDLLWVNYDSKFTYFLVHEDNHLMNIDDFFHLFCALDKSMDNHKGWKAIELNSSICDLEAFMPNGANEVIIGSY